MSKIETIKYESPICDRLAKKIESFYVEIFKYLNYDLGKALAGKLSPDLRCIVFTASESGNIEAAAACLYNKKNPRVAILGPVAVNNCCRQRGLGFHLCGLLLDELRTRGTQAVYLGVKNNLPAEKLYKKLGFEYYSGIVMRKLLVSDSLLIKNFACDKEMCVRKVDYSDFAGIAALLCEPCKIYNFDFTENIFSSRYKPIKRFLPIFPDIMSQIEQSAGSAYCLSRRNNGTIVGCAFIKGPLITAKRNFAILEFFILDDYLDHARRMITLAVKEFQINSNIPILCYCYDCDVVKKNLLLELNSKVYSIMPCSIKIDGKYYPTTIFQMPQFICDNCL